MRPCHQPQSLITGFNAMFRSWLMLALAVLGVAVQGCHARRSVVRFRAVCMSVQNTATETRSRTKVRSLLQLLSLQSDSHLLDQERLPALTRFLSRHSSHVCPVCTHGALEKGKRAQLNASLANVTGSACDASCRRAAQAQVRHGIKRIRMLGSLNSLTRRNNDNDKHRQRHARLLGTDLSVMSWTRHRAHLVHSGGPLLQLLAGHMTSIIKPDI